MLDLPRDTKVCDLDIAFAVEKDIVQFDISVGDVLRVDIAKTVDDLAEDLLGKWLLETATFTNIVKKVTTRT